MLLAAKKSKLALDFLSCLDAECKQSALGNVVTENKQEPHTSSLCASVSEYPSLPFLSPSLLVLTGILLLNYLLSDLLNSHFASLKCGLAHRVVSICSLCFVHFANIRI